MTQIEFGRWTLELDAAATRKAYSNIDTGSPESCGCTPCLNFAAQRDTNFPQAIRIFMDLAGIPINREVEIYHNCRLDSGLHHYGGWFHFVGALISGADAFSTSDQQTGMFDLFDFGSNASAGITRKITLANPAFNTPRTLQLEFAVEIPWAIDAEEMA